VGLVLFLTWHSPTPLQAQTIHGTVIDDSTSQPIAAAEVALLDSLGNNRGSDITDVEGRFVLIAHPGLYVFRIRRIGYEQTTTGELDVPPGSTTVDVTLAIRSVPTILDPAMVTGERLPFAPGPLREFYRRKERGWGLHLTREEIEEKAPVRMTDVFWNLPGVRVRVTGGRGAVVRMTRQARVEEPCPPSLYVDGVRIRGGIDSFLNEILPYEVEAIEIYRGASETPADFLDSNSRCGVIVLWTRRGP
jgi:hypothetical protein